MKLRALIAAAVLALGAIPSLAAGPAPGQFDSKNLYWSAPLSTANGGLYGATLNAIPYGGGAGTLPSFVTACSAGILGYSTSSVPSCFTPGVIFASLYGVVCNGSTVNTTAIANADSAARSVGAMLIFPPGTCMTGSVPIAAGTNWMGAAGTEHGTIIKAIASLNADFITTGTATSTNADDVSLQNLTIDGNSANNTSGTALTISGARPTLINVTIQNAAGDGLYTDWNVANAGRLGAANGTFVNLNIDSTGKHGWDCRGPSDNYVENLIITDPSLSLNNGYDGWLLESSCNVRAINIHPSNRSSAAAVPQDMVLVTTNSNNFTASQFEGGTTPLVVTGVENTFSSSAVYAPRGAYAADFTGGYNQFSGVVGGNSYSGNPNWYGIKIESAYNTFNLIDGDNGTGSGSGAIIIASGDASNTINITGNRTVGGTISGTPAATDSLNIAVAGSNGAILYQQPNAPVQNAWSTWAPTVTWTGGTPTLSSSSYRYKQIATSALGGKTYAINISFKASALNGATCPVTFTLPAGILQADSALSVQDVASGNANNFGAMALTSNGVINLTSGTLATTHEIIITGLIEVQ